MTDAASLNLTHARVFEDRDARKSALHRQQAIEALTAALAILSPPAIQNKEAA